MNWRFGLVMLALAGTMVAASAEGAEARGAAAKRALHALFDAEWERNLRESPETATYQGDTRYDDRWSDLSLQAIAASEKADRAALEKLRRIDRRALSADDQLNHDTFAWQLERRIEGQRFREYLAPVSQRTGVQLLGDIGEIMPFEKPADYRRYLARLARLPTLVDQVIALMREGLRTGQVTPKVLMERVPAQISAQIVEDPPASPFYRPFKRFPERIGAAEREALAAEAGRHIRDGVVPAYRRLLAFVRDEYLPRAGTAISARERPDGAAWYAWRARLNTTTDLGVDEIHQIGVKEVARLRAAMDQLQAEIGYTGSRQEFFHHLRTDPKFFETTPEAVLQAYRAVAKRIDPELARVFRVLPRMPYGVRPVPPEAAPAATTGYYTGGAFDGSRPAYFYANTYKPESRPRWEMLALTLHEAAPGHHTQFARALELDGLPMFRKTAYFVAYGEGWALYAEQLGYDMGLYDDPYERFGQLAYEMWRAVRLVVDTGMHAKGWSREQAIAYFKDHSPKAELDIVNEIDRYIGDPGQALAYKLGELRITGLRCRAEQRLGERFDLRAFNDAVLATGSVPLTALDKRIEAWIQAQARR
jgi:uncharacterized protein (DUF885 family)